jgi:hypothetical protein
MPNLPIKIILYKGETTMKSKSLLFALVALLIVCVSSSYAANTYGPYWITKCNVLPDAQYAKVYINDDYPIAASPDPYHYLITVYPNESILIPDSNYGIQQFGLNYKGDPSKLNVFVLKSPTDDTVDINWTIQINATSSFGPFDVFVYTGDTTGKYRKNPLRIYIGSATPLTCTDFYEPNTNQYMFACHIAGFKDMGGGITSAKFALPPPTVIELSKFKAIPANRKVILIWVTESEIDNTGFNILRAEAEDGEYIQLNDSIIPAKGSSVEGAGYWFIDNTVKNRTTYYYKLEDVDTNGIATQNGPVSATPRFIYGKGRLK